MLADGWFEWRKEETGKQPWFITEASGEPVSLAGLWERWERGSEAIESFTILATSATTALTDIHHRQPSILDPGDFDEWLAPDMQTARLLALARRAHKGPYASWGSPNGSTPHATRGRTWYSRWRGRQRCSDGLGGRWRTAVRVSRSGSGRLDGGPARVPGFSVH